MTMLTITTVVFFVQTSLSLIVYSLAARWYVLPFLARQPVRRAMTILLLPHLFHHIGLAVSVPSVVGPGLNEQFTLTICVGDTAVLVSAICALWALRTGSPSALPLLWTVTLIGAAYNGYAGYLYLRLGPQLLEHLRAHWYIGTMYVPLLMLSHVLIFLNLLRRGGELRRSTAQRTPDQGLLLGQAPG
jgi:hypothetical protein